MSVGKSIAGMSVLLAAVAAPRALGQIANGGFESPVTTDGPPFVGFWEAFNGGAGTQSANSNNMPRSGAAHLILGINNTDNTFAGVFQDVPGLTPGASVTFGGYHLTTSNPLDVGIEYRIEWRNSGTDTEVSRTANSTTPLPPLNQYAPFSLTATVPAGADTARVVYAVQSFGPGATNSGTVFVDDVSFVPEPAAAMLVLPAAAVACARRRRPSRR
jgi:hypothetical protein